MIGNSKICTRLTLAMLGMLFFALLACGILFFRHQRESLRQKTARKLIAIAQLKVNQITDWQRSLLAEATVLQKRHGLIADIQHWLSDHSQGARERVLLRLRDLQEYYESTDVLFATPDGKAFLSVNNIDALSENALHALESAMQGQTPFLTDLHEDKEGGNPRLYATTPLFPESGEALGAIIRVIGAAEFLYPLIQSWPVPSKTAETLLFRRDKGNALYLNELRHHSGKPLNLRVSLSQTEVIAVQGILGQEGFLRGTDYRGHDVVAAVQSIPKTSWFLSSEMDVNEAFAEWRFRSVLLLSLFLITAGSIVAILLGLGERNKRMRIKASETRYRRIFETTKDGLLLLDAETGLVKDVNPALIELLGYSREIFLGKKFWELDFVNGVASNEADFMKLRQKKHTRGKDLTIKTHAGRRVHVEFISNAYLTDHSHMIQCNIRDISERKEAEKAWSEERRRLNFTLEKTRTGIDVLDAEFNLHYVDSIWQKVYGNPQGRKCYEYFMGHNHPCPDCGVSKALETGKVTVSERFLTKENRFVQVHTVPFRNENNEMLFAEINIDITEQKHADKTRLVLLNRLEKAREEERTCIARDIHDDLGQYLTVIKFDMAQIKRKVDEMDPSPEGAAIKTRAAKVENTVDTTIECIQELSSQMQADVLDRLDLENSILSKIRRFQSHSGIKCILDAPVFLPRTSPNVATTVFRILQECLTNIERHANADLVRVRLGMQDKDILLIVHDNGSGISNEAINAPESIGLQGMKERASALGGKVLFGRDKKSGTVVVARIPNHEK